MEAGVKKNNRNVFEVRNSRAPQRSFKHVLPSTILALALSLVGCGDGGGSDSDLQSTSGVVSYDFIAEHTGGSTQKQAVVTGVNDIVNIGAMVCPALAPAAVLTGLIYNTVSSAQLNNQLNEIFNDINQLQAQVQTLQNELNFLNTDFMKFVIAQTGTDEYAAWTAYSNYINNLVSPSTGTYYVFQSAAGINPNVPVNYSQLVANIPQINARLQGQSQSFVTSVNNISATELPVEVGGDQIYKSVASLSDSAIENLFVEMRDYLYVNLPEFPSQSTGGNITTLIEQYNSQIFYVFQTTTSALQAAYTVSAAINQINYYQGTLTPGATPPAFELETNPNLYYSYSSELSAEENQAAYTNAQKQLALVFAARFNALFNLSVKYLISDKPFSDFQYPSMATGNPSIDKYFSNDSYQSIYNATIPSSKMASTSTNGQSFPAITTNSEGYIFYMESGLNQFTSCQNAFIQGQPLSSSNCPSLYGSYYAATQPGDYDGQNLQVWVMNPSGPQPMRTELTNLATRCSQGAMTNQIWQVGTVFDASGKNAGFSCPSGSLIPVSTASYSPNWNYSADSKDSHNYFYWDASNLTITNATGNELSYSNGSFTIETARVSNGTQFFIYLTTSNNSYQGAVIMEMYFTTSYSDDEFTATFPIYCPTEDPLCAPYQSGICLGGRYITFVKVNSNTANIVDNGAC